MLIGIVPEMDAVTLPICAVLATRAGRVVRDTGCVVWKNVPFTVTLVLAMVTPCVTIDPIVIELPTVTEPICAVPATRDGSELIVIEFPIVTDAILIGIVPEIDAVTEPICEVPATREGRVVSETGCVA
jgi:hypothetical protein